MCIRDRIRDGQGDVFVDVHLLYGYRNDLYLAVNRGFVEEKTDAQWGAGKAVSVIYRTIRKRTGRNSKNLS